MSFVIQFNNPHTRHTTGGKAFSLAQAHDVGLPVPAWFVVTPEAFDASQDFTPSEQVMESIRLSLEGIGNPSSRYAVRSSARDEDGGEHSFAGQLESFLNVQPGEVAARVADVWRSNFSERVMSYRKERGLPGDPSSPAVIVQLMVDAESAGVAFSADPISGRRGIAVVSAVRGLGESLVSGEADADTWEIDRANHVVSHRPANPRAEVLGEADAIRVAQLARQAQACFGCPQDIEWAIQGGTLWLLQSRPITTLRQLPDPDGVVRVWDNSNIAESYAGLTSPLTYTFARRAYEEVYRQFCRLMRVPKKRIEDHSDTFRCMIGLLRGRVYYNLVSWHQVLALLPGYQMNRGFMEQMMGVKEPLPQGAMPEPPVPTSLQRWRDGAMLLRSFAGLVWAHFTLPRQIDDFYARLNVALATPSPSLSDMRPDELAAHYRSLERQLLQRWDAPLVNDFLAMIFHGLLRSLCKKWCGAPDDGLANELIREQGGMISMEPAARMTELARLARGHPELLTALRSQSLPAVRRAAPPSFADKLDAYLEKFGDRCLDELKLESATLHDDPASLLQGIASIADSPDRAVQATKSEPPSIRGWLKRTIFSWVLRNARSRVRDRENLRFERTRLFGRVRRVFVELGRRLAADATLEEARAIFWLTLDEALGFVEGTTATTALNRLVALRKDEYTEWQKLPPPSDRCETRGTVHHAHDFQSKSKAAAVPLDGTERHGLGCCPGVVRGRARVITEPRGAMILPGEILVAERTDPGWVMLFPSASGLLVERGSLLSHSAIVSRELGLPSIVSITGLTSWLKTGDLVELDGASGIVRKLEPAA